MFVPEVIQAVDLLVRRAVSCLGLGTATPRGSLLLIQIDLQQATRERIPPARR
jgi:hypothetical protein